MPGRGGATGAVTVTEALRDPHLPAPEGGAARVNWGVVSDTGPVRTENEDSVAVLPAIEGGPVHLFAVADGLGGHEAGEVASRIAVETFAKALRDPADRPERWVRAAFNAANLAIWGHGQDHPEVGGLQTTATLLLVDGQSATIGHVGDCRLYRVRDDSVELCTTDHTRAMEMLRLRIITPEQAVDHPARSQLTRSLGSEIMVQVDVQRRPLVEGDAYVLCSDGLWSEVPRAEIVETVRRLAPEEAARHLADAAISRQAQDNLTVIVARVEQLGAAAVAGPRRWLPWR